MAVASPSFFPEWTDTEHTRGRFAGNRESLAEDLTRRLRGKVRFDSAHRALFATDASNYRQVPLGVVLPLDREDLVETVRICSEHGAPITHRGAGTSLAGQTANEAVIIDSSRYLDRILEIDAERRIARVEPGVLRDNLNALTVARHGLTFGPDTSTHAWATLGGMIGNNSCGRHSELAGQTVDNIEELEILLYDGTRLRVGATSDDGLEAIISAGGRRGDIYRRLRDLRDRYTYLIRERYPDIPRRISGYNLDRLLPEHGFHVARTLVGSEGTLATVLEATVKLIPWTEHRVVLVLGYSDVFAAGDDVARLKEFAPMGLEGMDRSLVDYLEEKNLLTEHLHLLPDGDGFLLAEFGGNSREEALERARECSAALEFDSQPRGIRLIDDPIEQRRLWKVRESAVGTASHVKQGDMAPGWEDSAVPPEAMGDYMRGLRELYDKYGFDAAMYGHFGQGCLHTRIPFDFSTEEGVGTFRAFIDEASDLCLRFGGSLSAEHGDGQARAELLPKMFGEELCEAFREFKSIWDPDWKMNPGKVVDPYRIDANLRLGPQRNTLRPDVHFAYPDDDGDFARVMTRCVGVGKCRKLNLEDDEVMCPSYLATREEMHTTRGRAHLLFEMLDGEGGPGMWQDDDVKEALDLCLACKGCKTDCPVKVDMATYKAEFLAHYYKGRLRPLAAYTLGLIPIWARLASVAPRLVNFITQQPRLAPLARLAGGIAPERSIPTFAEKTFKSWFNRRRTASTPARPRVMLWPDTFTNFFEPEVGKATVMVLEEAGYEVVIPQAALCCGRPLYDHGLLGIARRFWLRILDELADEITAGTPLIGIEPSCVAAFRDELVNLFPEREDARRLSALTFVLGDFLARQEDYEPPQLSGKALVHGHCHHKAVMGFAAEKDLLSRTGLDCDFLAAGCCGMAGSFGYERDHYYVSMACGEYRLLPAVREAADDVLIIADGFSCRHQIEEGTGRRALHLAEVLAGNPGNRPSDLSRQSSGRLSAPGMAAGAFAAGLATGLIGTIR